MKSINNLKLGVWIASLVLMVVWLTACDDTDGRVSGNNNNNNNGGNITNAPASLAGKSLTETITSGTTPFSNVGGSVIQFGGMQGDTTGNFITTGSGGVTNSTGTFSFVVTSGSTATLVLQDSAFGEVTEVLTFQTPTSGTFASSRSGGGTQAGSFITD
jgi:hypothetical protein